MVFLLCDVDIQLTDKDSDGIRVLDGGPELLSLHLLDGLVVGILLDEEPLQDAVLPLQVARVDGRLLSKVPATGGPEKIRKENKSVPESK
jgi:hypothetical protein